MDNRAEQDWFENSRGRDFPTTIKIILTFHFGLAKSIAELDEETRRLFLESLDEYLAIVREQNLSSGELTMQDWGDIDRFRDQIHEDVEAITSIR